MSEARVTSKGQITIPKAVRERLHLEAGDAVVFDVRDDGTVVMQARNQPWERLRGLVRPPRSRRIAVADMSPERGAPYDPGGR
ncbi:MAG: AbrB/MazE/SpoVT family DNA-binding domain-containing protein [Gemmatimonadota bacterium]|nr:AbrB/MazE/SpoVT family DNA-binding domain-containing protein [Gemmatimonadota bacterium]